PVVMRYASEFHSAVVAAQREVVEEHERHRRRARWHGYAFSVRHRLKAAVDAHSAAVDRAPDAYEAAVRDLRGTVERWDGRFEWASFTVAALRDADASLTERAAIARAATLLELPAVIVEAAVAADRPAVAPPGATEGADVAELLRGLPQGIHHDLQHATRRADQRLEVEGRALVDFYDAVRDAVVEASKSGMSNFRIHKITGIPFDRVAEMTRFPEANPGERLRWVDKFIPI